MQSIDMPNVIMLSVVVLNVVMLGVVVLNVVMPSVVKLNVMAPSGPSLLPFHCNTLYAKYTWSFSSA
jgi:hypothetical protein